MALGMNLFSFFHRWDCAINLRWDGQNWEILSKNFPAQHFLFYKGRNKAWRPHFSVLVEGSYEMRRRQDFVTFYPRFFALQQWCSRADPRLEASTSPDILLEVPPARHTPPDLIDQKLQGWGSVGCFSKLSRCLWCTSMREKPLHCDVAVTDGRFAPRPHLCGQKAKHQAGASASGVQVHSDRGEELFK